MQLDRFCAPPDTNVTVRVKIGSYFTINAPRVLEIQNILFDYADSLL